MLSGWRDLDREEIPGWPAGLVFAAAAIADDGAELRVYVYGQRPGSLLAPGAQKGSAWTVTCVHRSPTYLEVVEMTREAAQGSSEWFAAPSVWRTDLDPGSGSPAVYAVGGLFIGPVPAGAELLQQFAIQQPQRGLHVVG